MSVHVSRTCPLCHRLGRLLLPVQTLRQVQDGKALFACRPPPPSPRPPACFRLPLYAHPPAHLRADRRSVAPLSPPQPETQLAFGRDLTCFRCDVRPRHLLSETLHLHLRRPAAPPPRQPPSSSLQRLPVVPLINLFLTVLRVEDVLSRRRLCRAAALRPGKSWLSASALAVFQPSFFA